MRGIRQMASVPISSLGITELELVPETVGAAAARVKRLDYFVPPAAKGARILDGTRQERAEKLFEFLKAKGGLN
jgi:electron transfer flavoprotein beta subunit